MEPIVGDEVLFLRHILSSKALQPLLALVSYEADEEQYISDASFLGCLTP
jgi:hypothetical protein